MVFRKNTIDNRNGLKTNRSGRGHSRPGDRVAPSSFAQESRRRRNGPGRSTQSEVRSSNNQSDPSVEKPRRMSRNRLRMQAYPWKRFGREDNSNDTSWRIANAKVNMAEASHIVGTCQAMCPEKEVSDRILQGTISFFERRGGQADARKAVKKYRRSAAISEHPQPEEIRPPAVLLRTMDHLRGLCDNAERPFLDVHNFVSDRTRALRQDFTFQGVMDEQCIQVHEETVRFHIMSEHHLTGTNPDKFSSKQNREQLSKCFISLREMYDLRREKGLPTAPNEPEMQAYYLLTHLSNAQACVQAFSRLNKEVRNSLPVQFALNIVKSAAWSTGNYYAYFSSVRASPYLMSCMLETQFTRMRCQALSVLNSTHGNKSRRDTVAVSDLTSQLGFDSFEDTVKFCSVLGLNITDGNTVNKVVLFPSPSFDDANVSKWKPSPSQVVVEGKSADLTHSEIIAGSGANDYDLSKLPRSTSAKLRRFSKKPSSHPRVVSTAGPRPPQPEVVRAEAKARQSPSIPAVPEKERTLGVSKDLDEPCRTPRTPKRKREAADFGTADRGDPSPRHEDSATLPQAPKRHRREDTHLSAGTGELQDSGQVQAAATEKIKETCSGTVYDRDEACRTPRTPKRKRESAGFGTIDQGHLSRRYEESETHPRSRKRHKTDDTRLPVVNRDLQDSGKLRPIVTGHLGEAHSKKVHGSDASAATGIIKVAETETEALSQRIQCENVRAIEELRHKEMFERAVLQRRKELEQARKELAQETARAEAFSNFERIVRAGVDIAQGVKAQLLRVQSTFKFFSRFDDRRASQWKQCEEANKQLEEMADDLYRCSEEVRTVQPLTALGREARRLLLRDLTDLDSFGKDVWKLVWDAGATCLLIPKWNRPKRTFSSMN